MRVLLSASLIGRTDETSQDFPSSRLGEVEVASRGRGFVDFGDQWSWTFPVSNRKSTPPPCSEARNVDRRNDPQTRPTSAASRTKPRACIWTSMFPALWSVRHVCQCQTYDSESQCATGFVRVSSVSLACGITNKSRRLNLKHIDINTTSLKTRNVSHTSYHPVLNSNSCDVACGPAAGHRGMCFHLVLPCP